MQASAHILLLLLALLLESYLRLQHRRRQAAGYLAFYWRTRSLLPLATRVTALGQVPPTRPSLQLRVRCGKACVFQCLEVARTVPAWVARHLESRSPG